ncbi:glutamine-rich protein 2-like [Lithobates pipiens]
MTEKQIYDENIQAAEERNQRYRDDVLKRLENVEHSAMELEVHTAQNTKERQDLAAKLDSRTFDAFAAQICQTIKQQIDEGLKGQEAKWTSVMDKAKEEEEKKLKKMEDYITAMENGWKKTIKKLMEPPPKEEVDEDAACTTHCLSCSRNVKTTTKSTLPALPAFPALPNPPSRGVTRNHRAP